MSPDEPHRRSLPLATLALKEARDFIGLEEQGQNRGPTVEWLQKLGTISPGDPWCAAFVNGAAEIAAAKKNMRSPLEQVALQGYVQSYVDWGEAARRTVEPDNVGLGDLFCLYHGGKERYAHMGFVHRPPHGGIFTTCEANTGDQGEREGYKVAARERDVTEGTLFIAWTNDR